MRGMAEGPLWKAFTSRTVFGFHGNTASRITAVTRNGFHRDGMAGDWLGPGFYFWLDAPERAWQWADEIAAREARRNPSDPREESSVIIAELEYTRYWIDLIESTPWFERLKRVANYLDENGLLPEQGLELSASVLHRRDYAVFEAAMNAAALDDIQIDAVRCAFLEGNPVCEGSAIYDKAHVQIAVRNPGIIHDHELIVRPDEY
jgi:hypothetical protein